MQIKIRYDNHFQTVEVTEAECESMIRNDYEERLAAAADPSTVQPRTMQEIMDERFNRPEFNSYHQYHVHNSGLEACDYEGESFIDPNANIAESTEQEEMLAALHDAIQHLLPHQRELLYRVLVDGETQAAIAAEDGVSSVAVHNRMQKIYAVLRKKMKDF